MENYLPAIFLVGPMGAGKTTIGKILAKHLNREFIDVDEYIVNKTGADIAWIFEKEGEEGFRDRETKAIQELTLLDDLVLSTGGGVVMRAENRQCLSENGLVIYLNADVSVQIQRTKKDKKRPLLQNANPEKVLQDLYDIRNDLYREVADIEVISGRHYPKAMGLEVLSAIRELGYEI